MEQANKIEGDMAEQHAKEQAAFEEQISRQGITPPKFSPEFIDKKFKLEQLLRNKKYAAAKALKEQLDVMEEEESEAWVNKWVSQKGKHRELLAKKQKNEADALKARLEKNINSKLKIRMREYDKLLQRIQNIQNELMTRQALTFAKISSANAKLLAKYLSASGNPFEVLEGEIRRVLPEGARGKGTGPGQGKGPRQSSAGQSGARAGRGVGGHGPRTQDEDY